MKASTFENFAKLFEDELLDSQNATGMKVLGEFHNLASLEAMLADPVFGATQADFDARTLGWTQQPRLVPTQRSELR